MPYTLRSHAAPHAIISTTNDDPEHIEGDSYSQAGWNPNVQGADIMVGAKYRLDGDRPNSCAIKVVTIGAGKNSVNYTRVGLA